jgi:hypothetical protein
MKRNLLLATGLLGVLLNLNAAILPPEQLLPADTLAVFTVPDMAKAQAAQANEPSWQLWSDPALKPFREKLENKLNEELVKPLERELGIKFAEYSGLAQGQWTFAVVQNGWQGKAEPLPAWLLLLDAKDKKGELGMRLAELRKKLTDAGKKSRVEKIRDLEFTTLSLTTNDLPKVLRDLFPSSDADGDDESEETPAGEKKDGGPATKAEPKPASKPVEITFGQFDSLLLVGNNPKAIERVLIRQSGGPVPPLQDDTGFQKEYQARFRDALAYGWIHLKPLIEVLAAEAKEADSQASGGNSPMAMPQWSKVLSASGLAGLRSASMSMKMLPEGGFAEFALGVPADARAGFFKMLSFEPKEAGPTPFIPANAITFQRVRLDLPKAWAALEKMVIDVFPQAGSVLDLMFQTAGKDKDPNYNLKAELLGNLGDDLINYELAPRGTTFAEMNAAPSLFLLGSPNVDKLVAALKAATTLFPPPFSDVKEREFQGRKIYSIELPAAGVDDSGTNAAKRAFSFAAASGYVAMSMDAATLEAHLRSAETPGKSLRDTPGLADAAQKVGGLNTGLFGYYNDAENLRVLVETFRKDTAMIEQLFGMMPFGASAEEGKRLKDWVDFSLLPPFEKIAKYFHFSVFSASLTADGFNYKAFSPTPPQLKK